MLETSAGVAFGVLPPGPKLDPGRPSWPLDHARNIGRRSVWCTSASRVPSLSCTLDAQVSPWTPKLAPGTSKLALWTAHVGPKTPKLALS